MMINITHRNEPLGSLQFKHSIIFQSIFVTGMHIVYVISMSCSVTLGDHVWLSLYKILKLTSDQSKKFWLMLGINTNV